MTDHEDDFQIDIPHDIVPSETEHQQNLQRAVTEWARLDFVLNGDDELTMRTLRKAVGEEKANQIDRDRALKGSRDHSQILAERIFMREATDKGISIAHAQDLYSKAKQDQSDKYPDAEYYQENIIGPIAEKHGVSVDEMLDEKIEELGMVGRHVDSYEYEDDEPPAPAAPELPPGDN